VRVVHSPDHAQQHARGELADGRLMDPVEKPARAEMVLARVRAVGLGPVVAPDDFGRDPLARIHTTEYLDFLETAWADWVAEHGAETDALPLIWPVPGLRRVRPEHIDGRVSYHALDAGTPITPGTWTAARASANVALTAARLVQAGERAALALGRPPGHHATRDQLGGYCFLNNAALAAQTLLDGGAERVAVLDVDYHHGNGTQAIFADRADVLFCSIHADPAWEFPYFLGYADETGTGPGAGYTANYPLPFGTTAEAWMAALEAACTRIAGFGPDALVVSLGVDTYKGDPISRFALDTPDYPPIGRRLARLDLPTVFVLEGGYAVEAIGHNAVGVLEGFEDA
jgi:acetoin utilization deacetylase AcuC-like enzyme